MNEGTEQKKAEINNSKVIKKLVLVVFAMFSFGFALVPLYDVFCDITGLNGKTNDVGVAYENEGIDTSRIVKVQFITRMAKGIPWQFEPVINEISVHPGEVKFVNFYAKNKSKQSIVGQAVPSVSPGLAAGYFQKIECFCFDPQEFSAGEARHMPVRFYLDEGLPRHIDRVTLSYTLFEIK